MILIYVHALKVLYPKTISVSVDFGRYTINTKTMFWNDSRQHCLSLGADLVTLETQEEFDNVSDIIRTNWDSIHPEGSSGKGYFWTGLNDIASEGMMNNMAVWKRIHSFEL